MMTEEIKNILIGAKTEIQQLRRANEILGAKVEMIELFAMVLHTQPAQPGGTMTPDIVHRIHKELDKQLDEKK
jgi:hypothetical protein